MPFPFVLEMHLFVNKHRSFCHYFLTFAVGNSWGPLLQKYMENSIDYHLIFGLMNGQISSQLKRRLNDDFKNASLDMSSEQWDVLLAITMHSVCTQQDLCNSTSFSKATMTRLLNTLEEKGIILRDKSRVDWRSNYIRITRLGEKIREKANFIAMQTLKDSLRGLSRQEIFIAQKSLNTVLSNLNEMNRQKNVNEMEENIRKRREKLIRKLILHKK